MLLRWRESGDSDGSSLSGISGLLVWSQFDVYVSYENIYMVFGWFEVTKKRSNRFSFNTYSTALDSKSGATEQCYVQLWVGRTNQFIKLVSRVVMFSVHLSLFVWNLVALPDPEVEKTCCKNSFCCTWAAGLQGGGLGMAAEAVKPPGHKRLRWDVFRLWFEDGLLRLKMQLTDESPSTRHDVVPSCS